MHLAEKRHLKLLADLRVIAGQAENLGRGDFAYSEYDEFFRQYSLCKTSLKQWSFEEAFINDRINQFPTLVSPRSVFVADWHSGYLSFVFVNPYLVCVFVTATASVTIPFLAIRLLVRKKLREDLREIARLSSSVAFIIEHPDYFHR